MVGPVLEDDALPDIPSFLKRNANNQSEITRMKFEPKRTYAAEAEVSTNGVKPPKAVKAAPKAKVAKAAPKAAVKAVSKAAKAVAKAAPAKPAKVTKKAVPRAVDPAKLDEWGLRKGSIRSKAADLYSRKQGATLHEVKEKLDSVQFNVIKELRGKGFKVEEKLEDGPTGRRITRYFLKGK